MKCSIIIPVFNEEKTIIQLLERIHKTKIKDLEYEIIVINDGSHDDTKLLLEKNQQLFHILINNEKNFGKGYAINLGIKASNSEYIIFQDADLEYDPSDYVNLIQPLLNGKADAVYGSRFLGSISGGQRVLYYSHRVANFLLTTLTCFLTNINFSDMETGYKAFRAEAIKNINLKEKGFGIEPEITIKLSRKKIRFFEVGISYNGRTYNEGKKIKLSDAFIAVYCLFKYRFF